MNTNAREREREPRTLFPSMAKTSSLAQPRYVDDAATLDAARFGSAVSPSATRALLSHAPSHAQHAPAAQRSYRQEQRSGYARVQERNYTPSLSLSTPSSSPTTSSSSPPPPTSPLSASYPYHQQHHQHYTTSRYTSSTHRYGLSQSYPSEQQRFVGRAVEISSGSGREESLFPRRDALERYVKRTQALEEREFDEFGE